jgi:hypothetical protein
VIEPKEPAMPTNPLLAIAPKKGPSGLLRIEEVSAANQAKATAYKPVLSPK